MNVTTKFLHLCGLTIMLAACSSDKKNEAADIPIAELRQQVFNGEFISSRKFVRVAEDFSQQIDDMDIINLLDCHTYIYALSPHNTNMASDAPVGNFSEAGLAKPLQYRYELGYDGMQLAITRMLKTRYKAEQAGLSNMEIQAKKQYREYTPIAVRECYWTVETSVTQAWFCSDEYFELKAKYEFEPYLGNLPKFCDNLVDSYLESGTISPLEKVFKYEGPSLVER